TRRVCVAVRVSVILACGIADPEGSVTTPDTLPPAACAYNSAPAGVPPQSSRLRSHFIEPPASNLDDPAGDRDRHCLRPIAGAEFFHEVLDMHLDGLFGDA